ncbi:conserved hypothetical protein [Mesorhizobium sp. ORS 3324]|nr:conserved hypothetical protein [Mesorhizobium sp. ORS 3324]
MTYISFRTFQPTSHFGGTLVARAMTVVTTLRRRYHDAMQRRALAGLSMPELKDFGYPADEAPADLVARGRIAGRCALR